MACSSKSNPPSSTNEVKEWCLSDFEIGRKLGYGQYGKVYLAREKVSKYVVAIKVIWKKKVVKCRNERQIRREIEILAHLRHKNIVRLFTWFHDPQKIYLILEYCANGEVFDYLQNKGKLSEMDTAKYINDVASALNYCKTKHVGHRDIKPENLLFDGEFNIKLCDFGWGVHDPKIYTKRRNTLCGTVDYLPPEMCLKLGHNLKVDTWALGVLMYEFLCDKSPFSAGSGNYKDTIERIKKADFMFPGYVSHVARDLISKLLTKDPTKRLCLARLPSHPFIVNNLKKYDQQEYSVNRLKTGTIR